MAKNGSGRIQTGRRGMNGRRGVALVWGGTDHVGGAGGGDGKRESSDLVCGIKDETTRGVR